MMVAATCAPEIELFDVATGAYRSVNIICPQFRSRLTTFGPCGSDFIVDECFGGDYALNDSDSPGTLG
jgi:hypothetical protein